MVLMATDLPDPVVPAIRRCGIRARSTITGSPPIVLARQSGSRAAGPGDSSAGGGPPRPRPGVPVGGEELPQIDFLSGGVWQLDADHVAPGHHGDAGGECA